MATFPQIPRDVAVELFLNSTWVDVTAAGDVRVQNGIFIARGRPNESSSPQPSTCLLTFDNRSGNYSLRNPTGLYYGQLGRNTPIRVSVGLVTDTFTRTVSSSWGTSDTGHTYALTGVGGTVAAANWNVAGGVATVSVPVANATRTATIVGIAMRDVEVTIQVSLPFTDVTGAQLAASITLRDQGGGHYIYARVFINTDESITLGIIDNFANAYVAVDTVIAGLTHSSSQPLRIRAQAEGNTFRAKVWAAGANEPYGWQVSGHSTAVVDPGTISVWVWVLAGNTNTLPIIFSIDNIKVRSLRFSGEIAAWPQRWDISGNDITAPIEAAGITRRLGHGQSPLRSTLYTGTLALLIPAVAYWPCEDGSDSSLIASPLGGPAMIVTGASKFATYSNIAASAPLPEVGLAMWDGKVPAYTSTGQVQLRYLIHLSAGGPAFGSTISQLYTAGTAYRWEIYYGSVANRLGIRAYSSNNALLMDSGEGFFPIDDNDSIMHTGLTQTGSDVFWELSLLKLGNQLVTSFNGTLVGQTIGSATRVVISPLAQLKGVNVGHITVRKEVISSVTDQITEVYANKNETAGNRMSRLCGIQGVPFTYVNDFGGGLATTAAMGFQHVETFLTLVNECADADLGSLYEPRGVSGLEYRTRASLYFQTAIATLNYAGEQVSPPFEPVDDDQLTRNDITLNRRDGSSVRAQLVTGRMSLLDPSLGGAGRYDTQPTVNVATDDQLDDVATWLLNIATVDETRYPKVRVDLSNPQVVADASLSTRMLDLNIDDRFVIINPKAGQTPNPISQLARGYTELIGLYDHEIVINAAPESPYATIVLDAGFQLDTDGSTLSAGASSSATSLSVATPSGVLWKTGAVSISIDVAGERMTATNITGASSPQTFTVTRSVNGVIKAQISGAVVKVFSPAILSL